MNSMRSTRLTLIAIAGLLLTTGLHDKARAAGAADLETNFLHPPASARPWVYWFWLNGNITSNGITGDLEAMQRAGIGGVLIMEVDQGAPAGPAGFGTPPWRELFKYVCTEASRLGLEVNMNNDAGWCGSGGPWITPDLAMQKIVWSETNAEGPGRFDATLAQPSAVSNYFRDIAVLAFPTPAGNARVQNIDGKAAFVPKHIAFQTAFPVVPADETTQRDRMLDLTRQCDAQGHLVWDVPPGKWTILRFGHTPTGKDNHPAPEPGRGLESDKLSKQATEVMFNGLMGKLIADSRPLAGKTLVSTHIDSWETGSQNWTPLFREEFHKRRGYDPLRFLPVLTGRVVDSVEISERFLWDLRQTVSDLLVENYSGYFRQLAHRHGLRLSIEAYDGTPCDDLTYAGTADEPMAEFWSWGFNTAYSCVEMSSAAHVYGKRILGAEAFTASDGERWLLHPGLIKPLGDWAFCEGINRFVFHRYALQPWLNVEPGMSMGPWGLHYERTQTWWEQSAAWHEYLARCQYLLRQGLFVADLCFLEPEGSPMRFTPTMPWRNGNTPDRPRYNFDGCSPEVVLHRMKVRDGDLVLPDGMNYRALVLPQVESMTPALLRRIKELVSAGATVIGPPPRRAPGLAGYPGCDAQVQQLARELWGDGVSRYWSNDFQASPGSSSQEPSAGPAGHKRYPRTVLWGPDFKTPQPAEGANLVQNSAWIWYPEGNPVASAPPGKRYFRRLLMLDPDKPIVSARFCLTVDNAFEFWVNGRHVGSGDNFKQVYAFDLAPMLRPGTNLIAVAAENTTDSPSPAAFIGALELKSQDGSTRRLNTDREWLTATNVSSGWQVHTEIGPGWVRAMELGPLGMQPWGDLDPTSGPPYVFPDFQAIVGVLQQRGIPPDFEGDSSLRFIHRRSGEDDIYFVANSQTNWIQAQCGFRVSGKRPEFWDPMTGRTVYAAAYEEKGKQTFVPITLEPAGSVFVLFREREADRVKRMSAEPIVTVRRNERDMLPVPGQSLAEPPSMELVADLAGDAHALAWESGQYQLRTAAGRVCSLDVTSLPPAFEIPGAWQVQFQAGRDAPAELTFPTLIDWAQHNDPGVRYFSGTATYAKRFDAPPQLLAAGIRAFLDLGEVLVMAQVKLNGKDLGTLWKAPFRVEVTQSLKPGENLLEVKVVNLWINRMIGDEQLPEDSDRNANGTLKQWPDWLGKGLPGPTGRFTFTSWRLWKKDSPLQPSGLLGPVRIVCAKDVRLPGPR